MSGTSLLALIDDIASILDDVAVLSKIATKKTTGVLGDDLALNAQQVSGVNAERELPVVMSVAAGSLKNKIILVPTALLISAFAHYLINPLLIVGGAYLCFEGFEKVFEKLTHKNKEIQQTNSITLSEKEKINGAIRTDFILSAEIVVITLGSVANSNLLTQVLVLSLISILMTIGVYGLVAIIVKLDDIGLYLLNNSVEGKFKYRVGNSILIFAPKLMKLLGLVGTIAMFLVGGGIFNHSIEILHHFQTQQLWPIQHLIDLVMGISLGLISFFIFHFFKRLKTQFL